MKNKRLFLKSALVVAFIFSIFILPTLFVQSMPSTPTTPATPAKEEPRIESKKTYSPTTQNSTWYKAWNGYANNPPPDYTTIPYRNIIKNPSGEVGTLTTVTDWDAMGDVGYTVGIYHLAPYFGSHCITAQNSGAAGATYVTLQQELTSYATPSTTFMFAIRQQTAVPTLTEYTFVELFFYSVDGAAHSIQYVISSAAGAGQILVGTAIATWYYQIRNITADALYFGYAAPNYIVSISLSVYGGPATVVEGWLDSLYLGDDQVYEGSNPWYNNEFEDPRNAGIDFTNNFYPIGWTTGSGGGTAGTCSFQWSNRYLHYWSVQLVTTAVFNAYKIIQQALGTNPATYISFALYGNTLPAAGNCIEIEINDNTIGSRLIYEFGTGAAAVRVEGGNLQVIHEQINVATWYYRTKNWQTDWAAAGQFGVAPNMADDWRLRVQVFNDGVAGAMTATFDAIWMGNTLPPKYNCFMFGDFRNAAWYYNFNGETAGFLDEYGFDFDGLFLADDIGAATSRYAQVTMMVESQPYSNRHLTFGLGNTKVLSWTDGAGTEKLIISPKNISTATWVAATTPDSGDIWNTGQTLYPLGSTMTFDVIPTTTSYLKIQFAEITGAGGAIDARIVIRWMAIEISNPDADISISYYDLDGWGVDYWKVQTYINGTRYVNSENTIANAVGSVLNITVTDYFGNILYQDIDYPITTSTTNVNVQLQLVSTTLQSYGLTQCDIYGNVTFFDAFNTIDLTNWNLMFGDPIVDYADIVNGRLHEHQGGTPGMSGVVYQLINFYPASTVTVYAMSQDAVLNSIYIYGMDTVNDQFELALNPGAPGGDWQLGIMQGGAMVGIGNDGVFVVNTWYKIVIIFDNNLITVSIYNPDNTLNAMFDTWHDPLTGGLMVELSNLGWFGGATDTYYDFFVIQGNIGYFKTLSFYDSVDVLLTPQNYSFNVIINNEPDPEYRIQNQYTIALTINRMIKLYSWDAFTLSFTWLDAEFMPIPFGEVMTFVNGSIVDSSATFYGNGHVTLQIEVEDYFGNTLFDYTGVFTDPYNGVNWFLDLYSYTIGSYGLTTMGIIDGWVNNYTFSDSITLHLHPNTYDFQYRAFNGALINNTGALVLTATDYRTITLVDVKDVQIIYYAYTDTYTRYDFELFDTRVNSLYLGTRAIYGDGDFIMVESETVVITTRDIFGTVIQSGNYIYNNSEYMRIRIPICSFQVGNMMLPNLAHVSLQNGTIIYQSQFMYSEEILWWVTNGTYTVNVVFPEVLFPAEWAHPTVAYSLTYTVTGSTFILLNCTNIYSIYSMSYASLSSLGALSIKIDDLAYDVRLDFGEMTDAQKAAAIEEAKTQTEVALVKAKVQELSDQEFWVIMLIVLGGIVIGGIGLTNFHRAGDKWEKNKPRFKTGFPK